MSTRGQFNTKNPTIKRILKEAAELASNPSPDYHAEPLENDLFEWHFTLCGPPEPSPFAGGMYHGRIQLPAAYPLRPPAFRFLTPTGRFEVNREICLSISGHHEESWQPAWGLRTALVAIRSFMDTTASGQLGGLDSTASARKKMAAESKAWKCPGCGVSNGEIMKARLEAVHARQDMGDSKSEEVPEELKLAYREELKQQSPAQASNAQPSESGQAPQTPPPGQSVQEQPISAVQQPIPTPDPISTGSSQNSQSTTAVQINVSPPPTSTPAAVARRPSQVLRNAQSSNMDWLDKAIWAVIAALVLMVLRKFF